MSQNRGESASTFTARKTGYNRHFPRSFLLNCGPALQNPSDEAILSRLRDLNCEWLKRPNIAASEFAMTLKDNMPLIRRFSDTVFDEEFVEDLLESFDPLLPAMRRLDNKDKTEQTPLTREDVIQLLKNVDENETLHECIMDGYNAAGALMMLSTHVLAIQTLMRNTEDYAEKTTRSASSQAFKNDPTPRGMRNYILDSINKRRRAVPRHISVWDEQDDEDEVPVRPSASRRRSNQRTATRTPVTSACKKNRIHQEEQLEEHLSPKIPWREKEEEKQSAQVPPKKKATHMKNQATRRQDTKGEEWRVVKRVPRKRCPVSRPKAALQKENRRRTLKQRKPKRKVSKDPARKALQDIKGFQNKTKLATNLPQKRLLRLLRPQRVLKKTPKNPPTQTRRKKRKGQNP